MKGWYLGKFLGRKSAQFEAKIDKAHLWRQEKYENIIQIVYRLVSIEPFESKKEVLLYRYGSDTLGPGDYTNYVDFITIEEQEIVKIKRIECVDWDRIVFREPQIIKLTTDAHGVWLRLA